MQDLPRDPLADLRRLGDVDHAHPVAGELVPHRVVAERPADRRIRATADRVVHADQSEARTRCERDKS